MTSSLAPDRRLAGQRAPVLLGPWAIRILATEIVSVWLPALAMMLAALGVRHALRPAATRSGADSRP